MKRKVDYRKILYGIAAAGLFLCLFSLSFRERSPKTRQNVQVVVFGDSVYGNIRDESSIPSQIGALLDKTVYNAAFGGTCASRQDREGRLDYSEDSLSLAALTKAVYADDFGVQQTIRPSQNATYYFVSSIDGLESIDFSMVETVIIGHGLNDYYIGAALDNEEDSMDEGAFAGALRKSVDALKKVNPDMRVILVTPTYSWLLEENLTCEEFNAGGGLLEEYVEKEIEVAAELGVEVIDLYHDFYPHENWEDWETYTLDGFHPNEAGRILIAERIAEYLEGEK